MKKSFQLSFGCRNSLIYRSDGNIIIDWPFFCFFFSLSRHPRRSPYQEYQLTSDHLPIESLDLQLNSSRTSTSQSCADLSDSGLFESVSLLSLSDQTTLESDHSPSPIDRTVIPSANLSVIERNARIIKWLFQLNKANAAPSFQTVQ